MSTQKCHDEVTKLLSEHWEMPCAKSYLGPCQTFFAKIFPATVYE